MHSAHTHTHTHTHTHADTCRPARNCDSCRIHARWWDCGRSDVIIEGILARRQWEDDVADGTAGMVNVAGTGARGRGQGRGRGQEW